MPSVVSGADIHNSMVPSFMSERSCAQQFPQMVPLLQMFVHQCSEAFGVMPLQHMK
jgi:hypothetical protein